MRISSVREVPGGTCKVIQAGGKTIALFNIDGAFYAVDNACTHRGGPLGEGRVDGTVVTCPFLLSSTSSGNDRKRANAECMAPGRTTPDLVISGCHRNRSSWPVRRACAGGVCRAPMEEQPAATIAAVRAFLDQKR
jgi:Rieske [2Fe-2S] domain